MKCDGCPPKSCAEFPPCLKKYLGIRSKSNPGNIIELHSSAHRIKPTLFDGIKLDYIHRLSSNKFVISDLTLSHNKPSGFRFGGVYTLQLYNDVMTIFQSFMKLKGLVEEFEKFIRPQTLKERLEINKETVKDHKKNKDVVKLTLKNKHDIAI